jgi:serine/threonine-protein kinase
MGEIALSKVIGKNGFEKLVVLKRLREDAERPDHRAMFDTEAELMSRIEHPNIVQVFDQPVIDTVPYLAMAYVRGRNLDQLIRRARAEGIDIPPVVSLTIVAEMLRGLAFIHRLRDEKGKGLGIVHQDITPSNILVSFFGEVKITDFGIAYVTSRDGGLRTGVLKGKPRYVAPEVLAGRRVNNRVDIYGVGVVMYELLKGRPLFARKKVQETLAAVAKNQLPDFSTDIPLVGPGVHRIMTKALSKDPQERFRTAEELNAALAPELLAIGGPISQTYLGNFLRDQFKGDRDAPEVDADVDIDNISMSLFPPAFKSPDLDQTLSELDKLLGGEGSSDVFTLPPELERELAGIADMDPFEALTPIPEFALDPNLENNFLMNNSVDGRFADSARQISTGIPTAFPPDLVPPTTGARTGAEQSNYGRPRPRSRSASQADVHTSTDVPRASPRKNTMGRDQKKNAICDDFDDRIHRRSSVTGEYSFAPPSRTQRSERPETGGDSLEQASLVPSRSGEYSSDHSDRGQAEQSSTDQELGSVLPRPELVDERVLPPAIPATEARQSKVIFFMLGLILGVLIGSILAAFFVIKLTG